MIRVLIVEDSVVIQKALTHILESDPAIKVIGIADNGEKAVEFLKTGKPDVVTMDIVMPGMDGIETTRVIMETNPLPIVIVSSTWNPKEVEKTFRAMEAGAVSVMEKPQGLGHPDYEKQAESLIMTVKLMSEVRVVKRWARNNRQGEALPVVPVPVRCEPVKPSGDISLVAIGASTGGPPVIQAILSKLPKGFPAPVLIVQHIVPGFIQGMAEWLEQTTGLPIHLASHGENLLPGHVYLAPDGFHMGIREGGRIRLSKAEMENGLRPSVAYLFRSVAEVLGCHAVGVILTGMGRDGADELKLMRERGAVTIAQDKASSIIHGMPGEAVNIGAAMYVLPPDKIAKTLEDLVPAYNSVGSGSQTSM